eukprot:7698331-Alexandrium_andersonii.AAC.1
MEAGRRYCRPTPSPKTLTVTRPSTILYHAVSTQAGMPALRAKSQRTCRLIRSKHLNMSVAWHNT